MNETGLECTEITENQLQFITSLSWWIHGVVSSVISVAGMLANLGSCFILTKKDMRNSFNLLLVMLAVYDTCYLLGAILDAILKDFVALKTDLHIVLFPHFLYPLHSIAMSGSVLMTVSIAFERYTAVHFPLNYNQVFCFSDPLS